MSGPPGSSPVYADVEVHNWIAASLERHPAVPGPCSTKAARGGTMASMTSADTPTAFVHAFHRDLSGWFSGQGSREEIWRRFQATSPAEMKLVYPSGARLSGAAFLDSIRDRFGTSPGFEASVSDVEELLVQPDHAVVAYVETQTAARHSATTNRRCALAVLERRDGQWRWRFIQETALADDGER